MVRQLSSETTTGPQKLTKYRGTDMTEKEIAKIHSYFNNGTDLCGLKFYINHLLANEYQRGHKDGMEWERDLQAQDTESI